MSILYILVTPTTALLLAEQFSKTRHALLKNKSVLICFINIWPIFDNICQYVSIYGTAYGTYYTVLRRFIHMQRFIHMHNRECLTKHKLFLLPIQRPMDHMDPMGPGAYASAAALFAPTSRPGGIHHGTFPGWSWNGLSRISRTFPWIRFCGTCFLRKTLTPYCYGY